MKSPAEKRREAVERMKAAKWQFSRTYSEPLRADERRKRGLPYDEETWNAWRQAEIRRLEGGQP